MTTVYINADTGNDSRTYEQAQNSATPWLTPDKVIASALDGDACIVQTATATYTCSNQTISKNVTFTGATTTPTNHVFAMGASRWTIGTASKTVTFNNIKVTGSGNAMIFRTTGDSSAFVFANCIVDADVPSGANNFIFGGSATSTFTFTNTLIKGILTGGTKGVFGEVGGFVPTFTLTNCTIYMPVLQSIFWAVNGTITVVLKNTFIYATGSTPYKTGTVNSTATYSDFYNITTSPTGTGVITSDPLFVDAANNNFNLQPDSPSIGTGST